ncbi:glucosaminidase domain-containing protein [Clostridium sp. K25]|uniref:glucosaminidase domain-containing protein n=1 Tax=Clostridium sp. K25 TaxID=1443109 RepID=UPI0004D683AB|nr:glucosaminidase domain-containing protein [Clostridium sp. K25]KEI06175.1 peptidoglycan hydrolase [Clostridium sp. K25]
MDKQIEFINKIKDAAIVTQAQYSIFASVTIAQAILESGWGESTLAQQYNNLFGIKALRDWSGETVNLDTKEWTNSGIITVKQPFRIYKSWSKSIEDHAKFLKKEWYIKAGVFTAKNFKEQIKAIFNGGYTSDPNYIDKILKLIEKYNLKKYDMGEINMNIIETNLNFKSLSWGNEPKQILLHHLEWSRCTVYDVDRCHKNDFGWSGIGYHFFVAKDGKIYRGRPEGAIGAHCKGHNTNTLGIGAEGNYMKETMPQAQKNAIVNLCKYLCNKYGIADVRGHKEAPYPTNCPGTNYPLVEIKAAIIGQAATTSASSLDGRMGVCTGNNVRLRSTTDTSSTSNVLGQLNKGDRIKIFKKVRNMYSVYYGAHGAYISADYMKLI